MRLLAIDTSTAVAGAALLQDGALVCEANLAGGLTHSQRLMDLVDRCMAWAGWQPGELDALAVVAGPGSFTGVRIGVATAKGMAMALGVPVVPVGTLEVLAAGCAGSGLLVAPLLDARRGQVYCAAYRQQPDGGGVLLPEEVLAPAAMALADFLALPQLAQAQQVCLCGDGVAPNRALIGQMLGERALLPLEHLRLQRAGAVAALGMRRWLAGGAVEAAALQPVYLRKPQAEQAREAAR